MIYFGRKKDGGYTLVELLVVMPIMVLSVAVLATYLITLYGRLLEQNGRLELNITAQQALFNTRDDLFFANRFAGTKQTDTTDVNQPSGGWNAITHNALIIWENAYTANRQTASRQLVYKNNEPYACASPSITDNQYSTNTVILFLSSNKLYRRVLVPDQTANCATTFRLQSCPEASATVSCPADTVIAEDVSSFTMVYYDRDNLVIPSGDLTSNPASFIQVQRAEITLALQKTINGELVNATSKISIKKLE